MYGLVDLNRQEGTIESNAGPAYNHKIECSGDWMMPGTNDNHPAYDFGSGLCGGNVAGAEVNGMSVGFRGIVFYTVEDVFWADYGVVRDHTGVLRHILMRYGHLTPYVENGSLIDHTVTVGVLNTTHQELEILFIDLDPAKLGYSLNLEFAQFLELRSHNYFLDPRKVGLEPIPSHGPR